jgi:predicted XRE-type DNA-binding protein
MTRKTKRSDIDYKLGSGNVYADLAFANSHKMLAKARIVARISRIIQTRKLTQAKVAALLGFDQPKVSALLRGQFHGYSRERLIGFLTKLGMDVKIMVGPKALRNQFPKAALRVRRFWLLLGWMLVLFVIYLSLTPAPVQLKLPHGDKLGHVLAYAALMSWFANLYEVSVRRMQFAIGLIALGISLEFVQRWTGYRSFEVADMIASAAGVAVGWVFASPRIPNYLHWMGKLFQRT